MDKFKVGDTVTINHLDFYEVMATPNNFKIRTVTGEWLPAYLYKNKENGGQYARSCGDMESVFDKKDEPCANAE